MMKRSLLVALAAVAMAAHPAAAAKQAGVTGQISGVASVPGAGMLANAHVRLRDLKTKEIISTTDTNASGQFVFVVPNAGEYIVEIVNDEGAVLGTTAPITLTPGAMIANAVIVAMTSAGSAAAAAGGPAATGPEGGEGAPPSSTQGRSAGNSLAPPPPSPSSIFASTAPAVSAAAGSAGSATGTVPSRGTASPSQ